MPKPCRSRDNPGSVTVLNPSMETLTSFIMHEHTVMIIMFIKHTINFDDQDHTQRSHHLANKSYILMKLLTETWPNKMTSREGLGIYCGRTSRKKKASMTVMVFNHCRQWFLGKIGFMKGSWDHVHNLRINMYGRWPIMGLWSCQRLLTHKGPAHYN